MFKIIICVSSCNFDLKTYIVFYSPALHRLSQQFLFRCGAQWLHVMFLYLHIIIAIEITNALITVTEYYVKC